jgi:hypothetical protein
LEPVRAIAVAVKPARRRAAKPLAVAAALPFDPPIGDDDRVHAEAEARTSQGSTPPLQFRQAPVRADRLKPEVALMSGTDDPQGAGARVSLVDCSKE